MDDFTEAVNAAHDGWTRVNAVNFTRATTEEVVAEMPVTEAHLQAMGIVHGGVYCALVETVASVGAAVNAMPQGLMAVGLDNHTSFIKAVRGGVLTARATPVSRGKRSHLWAVSITDDGGRLVAEGRVRLMCLPAETTVAGEALQLKVPTG